MNPPSTNAVPALRVAVLIPTRARARLLERALASTVAQTLQPSEILVVGDEEGDFGELRGRFPMARFILNERSPGLSGALNTALGHTNAEWVAVLDDDDWWEPCYLADSLRAASDLDIIFSGILRHEAGGVVVPQGIPTLPALEEFLVGNPGIQGSNLVVRRETLLMAGGWDERLPSTTDRDLMVRILQLPGVRLGALRQHLVHHQTFGHARLSDRSNPAKTMGLQRFEAKHRHRMTATVHAAFRKRGHDLFGWDGKPEATPVKAAPAVTPMNVGQDVSLLVGFSASSLEGARRMLDGLAYLRKTGATLAGPVIVDNTGDPEGLNVLASAYPGTKVVGAAETEAKGTAGGFGTWYEAKENRTGIAYGRTVLHHELYTQLEPGQAAWVLDDDLELRDLQLDGSRIDGADLARFASNLKGQVDVAVGGIHGDPPLPSAASTRVGLLDALHRLEGGPGVSLEGSDLYYDLSEARHDHLETPQPQTLEAWELVARVAAGSTTRPAPPLRPYGTLPRRGGNTLVFHPDCLREHPNAAPTLVGKPARRGDTLWLHLLRATPPRRAGCEPWRIQACSLSARQDRTPSKPPSWWELLADIEGASIVRGLEACRLPPTLAFEDATVDAILTEYEEARARRLRACALNFWRIQGLCRILAQRVLQGQILETLASIQRELDPAKVEQAQASFASAAADVRRFLATLAETVESYRDALRGRYHLTAWIEAKRVAQQAGHDVGEVLGHGQEGVVFDARETAVKVFHYGRATFKDEHLDFMKRLASARTTRFVPINHVQETELGVIVTMPNHRGSPYGGGRAADLVEIVREARAVGIVHTNACPRNLVVGPQGVVLVDPGRTLARWTPALEREMAKRLYLSYRWHHRDDLANLMRRASEDETLPELYGFQAFLDAIEHASPESRTYPWMLDQLSTLPKGTLLDFGSGKGRLASKLAAQGWSVETYDRNPACGPYGLPGTHHREAPTGHYDAVVCNLVLCENNDPDAQAVLRNLGRLVRPRGAVFLSLCNPLEHAVTATNQSVTTPIPYDVPAWRTKMVGAGQPRSARHRPWGWYARSIAQAGLRIEAVHEVAAVDLEHLCPASPQIMLRLAPSLVQDRSDVTLLIKASPMEWETVATQLRHLVNQLEGPGRFAERVVVTDHFPGPFARAYARSNAERLMAALNSLVAEGVVDRIVTANEPERTSQEWFGVASRSGRATNGQPTTTFLEGLDACRTRFVLHGDADVLLHRDPAHDPVADLLGILAADEGAVAVTPPICGGPLEPSDSDGTGPWRVESRIGLLDLPRLRALRPLPNTLAGPDLKLPWHRSLDRLVADGCASNWRAGLAGTWFAHVPNERKKNPNEWMGILWAIEGERTIPSQAGCVELQGELADWIDTRREHEVFLVRGRNVPLCKWRRAIQSIRAQAPEAGIVLIDAASQGATGDWLQIMGKDPLVTVLRNKVPLTPLENIGAALRYVCVNPESVIVQVDADDALLPGAVEEIRAAYRLGADLAIGGMLRTDKARQYPLDLAHPRRRGNNPWIHVRTFRRHLYDQISTSHFKRGGKWLEHAEDWALMVPLIEAAKNPVILERPCYWYEPSSDKAQRDLADREAIIAHVMAVAT